MLNFCTLFDSNYLSRGLTMYKSLVAHCPSFNLYIICLDDKLYKYLSENKLSNIKAISLSDIEVYYPELIGAKNNRSYVEYIFTLSPVIPLYLLKRFPEIELITSMDADIFFFSDPSVLLCDSDSFSIAITPHRFKSGLKFLEKYGMYNVSFQTFKNNKTGLECLNKWKEECINWCYDKFESNKFADQKYLDEWIKTYPDVKEYKKGSGVAPWNVRNKDIGLDEKGNILFRNEPLIYYHFHGLRNLSDKLLSIGLNEYLVLGRKKIIRFIYHKYIKELSDQSALINNKNGNKIKRGMNLKMGKLIFYLFLADLYRYENDKLTHIINFNFFRYINSSLKSAINLFRFS